MVAHARVFDGEGGEVKPSRAKRLEAVRRAKSDVCKRRGKAMGAVPFTCPRQARIYADYYAKLSLAYARTERAEDVANAVKWVAA